MTWDANRFVTLAQAAGKANSRSSLHRLIGLINGSSTPQASVLIQTLDAIPRAKRAKYKVALSYLFEYCPYFTGVDFSITAPIIPHTNTFDSQFEPSRGDVVYGIQTARCQSEYTHATNTRNKFCDHYNNYFGIGKGNILVDTKDYTFKSNKKKYVKTYMDKKLSQLGQNDPRPEFARAYHGYVLGHGIFNPKNVFDLPLSKLPKDKYGENSSELDMRHMKSVRRVCKAGIEMIAKDATFTSRGAKVHFVLDFMGDLGKVARKEARTTSGYVPITSSELCFCYRNWNKFGLANKVQFYINSQQVAAPWLVDWRLAGLRRKEVYANRDAWRRYGMKRLYLKGIDWDDT